MIKSCSSQIEYSAIFKDEETKVQFFLLKTNLGKKSRFYFQVIENNGWYNVKYEPLLTYWGPLQNINEDNDLLKSLRLISQNSQIQDEIIPRTLKAIFNSYAPFICNGTKLSKIKKDFNKALKNPKLIEFVDGLIIDKSSEILTLSSAQALSKKVRNSENLFDSDLNLLKILLTEAPLEFGYWGPFKTLLKFLDPTLMPVEFGKALGRLAKGRGFESRDIFLEENTNSSSNFENLNWMKYFIPIPSIHTYNYMSKRMRRFISKIAKEKPKSFITIASNILIEWDSILTKDSFIPAYILGGKEKVLDHVSRNVIPFIQDSRREAYPELWNQELKQVHVILNSIKYSPEILTFCLHILLENNQTIPKLNERQLRLALESSDPKVVNLVIPYIPDFPDIWEFINSSLWQKVLQDSNSKILEKLSKGIEANNQHISSLHYCLTEILENHINNPNDNIQRGRGDLSRIGKLYLLSFSKMSSWEREDESEVLLITSINLCSVYFSFNDTFENWNNILTTIDLSIIITCYRLLLKEKLVKKENLKIISDYIFNIDCENENQLIKTVKICFESVDPIMLRIGWHFIHLAEKKDLYYGLSGEITEELWEWLKAKATSNIIQESWSIHRLQLIVELLRYSSALQEKVFDLLTDNLWSFNKSEKCWLISELPELKSFTWDQLENEALYDLKDSLFFDSALVKSIGDSLSTDIIKTSGRAQQELLLKYINLNPSRVKTDRSFAIALVGIPNPSIQETVLSQLASSNNLNNWWLEIGELGLPIPLASVRQFLESEPDKDKFNQNIVACIDSMVVPLRDLGLELLDQERHRIDKEYIASKLVDSDDYQVQLKVAEEALAQEWEENSSLASFDKRILITRRVNRKAKELIKKRLRIRAENGENDYLAIERRESLIDLAKGTNLRDKEWALRRIAELSLQGVPFDNFQASTTTTTTTTTTTPRES